MFGSEQGLVQSHILLRFAYIILGEFRYPIRLRAAVLCGALPKDFYPKAIWDAGCGEGQTSFWLTKRFPTARLIGTDIKKENIERCDNIAQHLKRSNITFLQMDVLEDSFQSVDLIICSEVLEHIDNYGGAINIFSNSLNPEGLLVIHTPADNSFQSPTWGLRSFIHSETKGAGSYEKGQFHVRSGFNLNELTCEVETLGFHILDRRYTFGPIAMFAHTIYEWTRSRSKSWQIITLYPLLFLGYLDMLLSFPTGGGILIVAQRK